MAKINNKTFNNEIRSALASDNTFLSTPAIASTASVAGGAKLSDKETLFKKFTKLNTAQRTLRADPGAKPSVVSLNDD